MGNLKKDLSICIPCYEMNGKGVYFLDRLLQTIANQNFDKNRIEIVISDHSKNNNIEKLIESKFDLPLNYNYFREKRGSSSANLNNCIKLSKGKFIKPIFQDDFFTQKNSIDLIVNNLNFDWAAFTYSHYDEEKKAFYRERIPSYNEKMYYGENTIGPPSCMIFKNENNFFDENLIWFMDTEFYSRLFKKYGGPKILDTKSLIANTTWTGQVTNTIINNSLIEREKKYLKI